MTIGFLFWLLMILWLLFGLWAAPRPLNHYWAGGHVLLWLLLFLLGWEVFGFPIKG